MIASSTVPNCETSETSGTYHGLFLNHPLATALLDFLVHCIGCKIKLAQPCKMLTGMRYRHCR